MNKIYKFTNPHFGRLRVVIHRGELWFSAFDVCKLFGCKTWNEAVDLVEGLTSREFDRNEEFGFTIVSKNAIYKLAANADCNHTTEVIAWLTSCVIPVLNSLFCNNEVADMIKNAMALLDAYTDSGKEVLLDGAWCLLDDAHMKLR